MVGAGVARGGRGGRRGRWALPGPDYRLRRRYLVGWAGRPQLPLATRGLIDKAAQRSLRAAGAGLIIVR